MLNFIKVLTEKRRAKDEYWETLVDYLSDGELSKHEKSSLKSLGENLGLSVEDIQDAHQSIASLTWNRITEDGKITEEEKKSLDSLISYFGLDTNDFNFDQKTFNKMYVLGMIENGILPVITEHDIDIIYKSGEVLHWGCPGALRKYIRETIRINYSGPRASIRVMKGLRYTVGSYNVARDTREVLTTEDTGPFWITNQRIGFSGHRKNFSIPFNKLARVELAPAGLLIFKEGKETPYLIALDDYDVPLAEISHIINK